MDVNGAKTMEYRYKKGDKRSTSMDKKRGELAKKKAEIIRGQNSQTAAGSKGARMEKLSNTRPSSGNRPKPVGPIGL
jgi:hypothetical protein